MYKRNLIGDRAVVSKILPRVAKIHIANSMINDITKRPRYTSTYFQSKFSHKILLSQLTIPKNSPSPTALKT